MAIDDVEPAVAPIEQLRRERDGIRDRLGDGPADPSWDYRHLCEALAREKHGREGAQWRLDTARQELHDLGPIGRRTHRAERRELERRIAGFELDISRHEQTAADIEVQLSALTPEMRERTRWEREHGTDLDRLDTLERHIDLNERLDRFRTRERERERGLEQASASSCSPRPAASGTAGLALWASSIGRFRQWPSSAAGVVPTFP